MKRQDLSKLLIRGISVLLTFALCFLLCACGNGDSSEIAIGDEDEYAGLGDLTASGPNGDQNDSLNGGSNGGSGSSGKVNTNNDYLKKIPKKLQGTTVTFAVWGDENATEYAKVIKLFTKKTKINVKWVTYNEEKYISTIVEQNAAGKGPDIVINNITFPTSVEAVQELPAYFDLNDGFWDKRITEAMSVKGKNYFVNSYNSPFVNGGTFVFYNKQIFSNNNIKSPQDYVNEGKWTWENFEKCAKEAVQKGFDGGAVQPQLVWTTTGAGLINYNPSTATFTSGLKNSSQKSDVLEALKFVARLRKEGTISNQPLNNFTSGRMAMTIVNNYAMKYNGWFKGMTPSAVGVVNMPDTLNGKMANYLGSNQRAYGIGKDAKNIEGAYYVLRFFLDIDNYSEANANIFMNKNIEKFYKEDYLPRYKKNPISVEYMQCPLSLVGSPWTQASAGDWSDLYTEKTPEEVEVALNARLNVVENAANKATEKLRSITK